MSGPFGSSQWMYNAGGGFYDFPITNSLRFNDGDTASLARTPSSASNQKTWTLSCWVKRGDISTTGTIFEAAINGGVNTIFYWGGATLYLTGSTSTYSFVLSQLFRDVSAWYHLIIAMDTTQSTESNRTKIYINGSIVTAFATETYPSLNLDTTVNSAIAHSLGKRAYDTSLPFDGYLADVNFIDGLQLTPSSFGETKNDIWIPKDTSGLTFGTNGFRQQYKQVGTGTASSSTIGADTSGNDNHWTSNNLVASDVMPDSPTNNFATYNPLATNDTTLSEGNLKVSRATASYASAKGSFGMSEGSWYWEVNPVAQNSVCSYGITNNLAQVGISAGAWSYHKDGSKYVGATNSSYGTAISVGDVVGLAFNADTGTLTGYLNNTSQGVIVTGLSGTFFPHVIFYNTNSAVSNFGQDSSFAGNETAQGNADGNGIGDFYYAPPSGFLALCTSNLPDPVATIDPNQGGSPQDYFNTVLYTGTGGTQSISVGFQPDFTWNKQRSGTDYHALQNSVAGPTKILVSNTTEAERTITDCLTAFTSTGFTLGADSSGFGNENTATYASWNWKAGTAFSNDASSTSVGSIDSAGSVNTDVGFSIIGYTGTGSNGTIAHGLGVTPEMYIVKRRDADGHSWPVYTSTLGATKQLRLSGTNAEITTANIWNNTEPTSSVFSVGTNTDSNASSGTYIAYFFASVDGYSKFGSYTGNGNADGSFVYTGFRPALVIFKRTSDTSNWNLRDSKRDPHNVTAQYLLADSSGAEGTTSSNLIDFTSNGFKTRGTGSASNASGSTYIYMAFAEQPFKYANAR